jgi:acyl-CoA synthetase (AMP-forming)/AMP-acid ligase II
VIDAATGDTLSYAGLAAAAESFGAGLAERGFGRGSGLAILAPNIPEYPVVFHGAALAGGAVTTLNRCGQPARSPDSCARPGPGGS